MTALKIWRKKKELMNHIEGSPVSKGIFQYDMWGVTPN